MFDYKCVGTVEVDNVIKEATFVREVVERQMVPNSHKTTDGPEFKMAVIGTKEIVIKPILFPVEIGSIYSLPENER